ncbi:MAG TPA: hypothetical protein VIZ28_08340 [Chitinophagaceae bacterium]
MTDNQIIDQIAHSFTRFNLRDIQEINNNQLDFTIAEFILCSCLIDQISGFRYNTHKVGKRYRQFVKDYLPNYNSDDLYDDLRNKLVHNYSVGIHYRLTRKAAHLHLQNVNGDIYLNLENFIADIRTALEKYFSELANDKTIRQNALSWFGQHKIIGQSF